jgi:hypothetical protein
MDPVTAITIFNLIAPHVFTAIGNIRQQKPEASYEQVLREAGIELDSEQARLLVDMTKAVSEGAKPK